MRPPTDAYMAVSIPAGIRCKDSFRGFRMCRLSFWFIAFGWTREGRA
jgi:hypothetical protein